MLFRVEEHGIVQERVMRKRGAEMKTKNYEKICAYKRTMTIANLMLSRGIITPEEYLKIDKIIANKYGVNSCSIYRQKPLI